MATAAFSASSGSPGNKAMMESPRYWLINPLFALIMGPSCALKEETNLKFSSGLIFSEREVKSRMSVKSTVTIFSTWSPSFTSVSVSLPSERINSFGTNFFMTSWIRRMASSLSLTSRIFFSYNKALSMAAEDCSARLVSNLRSAAVYCINSFLAMMMAPITR